MSKQKDDKEIDATNSKRKGKSKGKGKKWRDSLKAKKLSSPTSSLSPTSPLSPTSSKERRFKESIKTECVPRSRKSLRKVIERKLSSVKIKSGESLQDEEENSQKQDLNLLCKRDMSMEKVKQEIPLESTNNSDTSALDNTKSLSSRRARKRKNSEPKQVPRKGHRDILIKKELLERKEIQPVVGKCNDNTTAIATKKRKSSFRQKKETVQDDDIAESDTNFIRSVAVKGEEIENVDDHVTTQLLADGLDIPLLVINDDASKSDLSPPYTDIKAAKPVNVSIVSPRNQIFENDKRVEEVSLSEFPKVVVQDEKGLKVYS